jgi:hypothetical protein
MSKKYTFIHPTKTGGTALEQYFKKNYNTYIKGIGHGTICTNTNNPIIVVRDVKSRFYSMYTYWKNGATSGKFRRNKMWIEKNKSITIIDFINILKTNKKKLYSGFTWRDHFESITKWIGDTDYKNIIIIKYEENLNDKIMKLIDNLGIDNKKIEVPIKNKSNKNHCKYELDNEYVVNFINEYFSSDIELINKIDNNPELFKMVI